MQKYYDGKAVIVKQVIKASTSKQHKQDSIKIKTIHIKHYHELK